MTGADKTHLVRLSLKRNDAAIAPLLRDLLPAACGDAMDLHHRLLWTLYAGKVERQPGRAIFLWRRMDDSGRFMMLGPSPEMDSPYFTVEAKPFDVRFREGQRLAFELRLNATTDIKAGVESRERGRRTDIVLAQMHHLQKDDRQRARSGSLRAESAQLAVENWMGGRSMVDGFALESLRVTGYRGVSPPGARSSGHSLVGISDVEGVVRVVRPDAFLARLRQGFGRMKAYGCGLMLVRPAR